MICLQAAIRGLGRVLRAPLIPLGLWLAGAVVAFPASWVVQGFLQDSVADRRVQEDLVAGFDTEWYGEFEEATWGLGETFGPGVTGAGAFYGNLESWLQGSWVEEHPALLALGAGYAALWLLLLGGVVDRYAHPPGRQRARRFFASSGRYFFRFVRLAALTGTLYWLAYRLSQYLFEILEEAVRDVTAERTVVLYAASIWSGLALLLATIHMLSGYAKIVTVIEQRRSALVALLRAVAFVARHPWATGGLYGGLLAVGGAALAAYAFVAPGARQSTWEAVAWAFAAGQLFLLGRVLLRLWLLGGQVELYRRLAVPPKQPAALDG